MIRLLAAGIMATVVLFAPPSHADPDCDIGDAGALPPELLAPSDPASPDVIGTAGGSDTSWMSALEAPAGPSSFQDTLDVLSGKTLLPTSACSATTWQQMLLPCDLPGG
jgi:hypothetical protein